MSVSREDEVVAQRDELRSRVRRVDDGQAEIHLGSSGSDARVAPMDVRIVQTDDLHRDARQLVLAVLEVHPAIRFQLADQVSGAPADSWPAWLAAAGNEVAKRIEWAWGIQIVGSQDEERGQPSPNRPKRSDDVLHCLGFSDDVAGDHDDVGFGQGSQEPPQPFVPVDHVEIRQVQDGESIRSVPG